MSPLSRREVISAALTASMTASALKRVSAQQASPVAESTPVLAPPGVEITPETVRFDEPFEVVVGGLDPFEQVTVHSSFDDGVGNTWKATVDVAANATGFLNVSGELPSDGTVPVADAMGLVWGALSGTAWVYTPHVDSEEIVTITSERASGPLTATVRRTFGDAMPTPVDLNEPAGLIGRYYPPAAGRTAPAIVQIGGSEGGLSDYMTPAARLLNLDGYAVLTLAYWGIDHLPSTMSRIPLEYFGAAIAWLQAQ